MIAVIGKEAAIELQVGGNDQAILKGRFRLFLAVACQGTVAIPISEAPFQTIAEVIRVECPCPVSVELMVNNILEPASIEANDRGSASEGLSGQQAEGFQSRWNNG